MIAPVGCERKANKVFLFIQSKDIPPGTEEPQSRGTEHCGMLLPSLESNQGEVALLVSPPYSYLNLCTHLEVWQMEKNPITVIHTHSCVSLPTSVYLQTACTKHMFLAEGLGPGLGKS